MQSPGVILIPVSIAVEGKLHGTEITDPITEITDAAAKLSLSYAKTDANLALIQRFAAVLLYGRVASTDTVNDT